MLTCVGELAHVTCVYHVNFGSHSGLVRVSAEGIVQRPSSTSSNSSSSGGSSSSCSSSSSRSRIVVVVVAVVV